MADGSRYSHTTHPPTNRHKRGKRQDGPHVRDKDKRRMPQIPASQYRLSSYSYQGILNLNTTGSAARTDGSPGPVPRASPPPTRKRHPKKENTMTNTRNTTPTTARLHRIKQGQEKLLTMRQQRQETLERMKDPTLGGIVDRSVTF